MDREDYISFTLKWLALYYSFFAGFFLRRNDQEAFVSFGMGATLFWNLARNTEEFKT